MSYKLLYCFGNSKYKTLTENMFCAITDKAAGELKAECAKIHFTFQAERLFAENDSASRNSSKISCISNWLNPVS